MKNLKIIIGIFVSIIVVFFLGSVALKNIESQSGTVAQDQKPSPDIKENDWVKGNRDSKVVLVEYLDFECEACGAYYPTTKQLTEEYGDSIAFVVRYFPLPGHKNSRTAAYAAEAAGKQGKFWEMYDILFTKQSEWGEKQATDQNLFEKYAVEAGLNVDQWKKDVASDEVKNRVEESYQEAQGLGLNGTPSFFLNGKSIQNPRGYEAFKLLIEKAKNN